MNKKIETLQNLRNVVEKELMLTHQEYMDQYKTYKCVIGHLFELGGVTEEQLIDIDNGKYAGTNNGIASIITYSKEHNLQNDFVKTSLLKLGFDLEEDVNMLEELQLVNIKSEGCTQMVGKKIDEILNQLKKEAV